MLVTLNTDRPAKSQPAACLLPGLDTSGGREWFNPNRVWTARRGVGGPRTSPGLCRDRDLAGSRRVYAPLPRGVYLYPRARDAERSISSAPSISTAASFARLGASEAVFPAKLLCQPDQLTSH